MGLLRPVEISGRCKQCGDKALHRLWSAELGYMRLCGKHMIEHETSQERHMTPCTLCSRYGQTTEATETRSIEMVYDSNTMMEAAPVCAACAEQVDRDASRQRQIGSVGGMRIRATLEVL